MGCHLILLSDKKEIAVLLEMFLLHCIVSTTSKISNLSVLHIK